MTYPLREERAKPSTPPAHPARDGVRAQRSAAQRVDVPTLLVRGAQSDIVSEDGVRELLELIPHARQADVSATGHMGDVNVIRTCTCRLSVTSTS